MLQLLLLRHAKSSWNSDAASDHQRPLNKRGREAAPRMGRLCREIDLLPDLILSSDSTRTRETVALFTAGAEYQCSVAFFDELYHASAEQLLNSMKKGEPAKRLMLVAHNPGMEDLVEKLSGTYERFPTGALAFFDIDIDHWHALSHRSNFQLRGLWRPKELPE